MNMNSNLNFLYDNYSNEPVDYTDINISLLKKYKNTKDESVKDKLILLNIKLVKKIAGIYSKTTKLEFEDLVQEGILGLIKAIEKFDNSMNTQFSTYAYYWIRQHIDRAICNKGNLIRIPAHVLQDVKKLIRYEKEHLNEDGKINITAICSEMDIPKKRYHELRNYIVNFQHYTSLNGFIDVENEKSELINYIDNNKSIDYCENNQSNNTEDIIFNTHLKKDLNNILSTLSPREEKIIKLRYGIYDGNFRSLEKIAKEFGLTRERIRQIESKALNKLKHYSRSKKVCDYYYN